jgi:predicted Ser/Thr protein kinase
MKVYRKAKSIKAVRQEAQFQQIAAKCGIAPQVYAVVGPGGNLDVTGPKIIMGLVGERVVDRITRQNGILTAAQQFSLLKTALRLDACGVRHNDPNPLNFMFSTKYSDDVMWIDYGFAKRQPSTAFNNLNSLRTLLRGGMQGIVSRGVLKPQGATIIDGWLSKLQEGGGTLTEEQVAAIERNEEA